MGLRVLPDRPESREDKTPPTVAITTPKTLSTVKLGSSVTIRATATDDVSVKKVEFYANNKLVCTSVPSPYVCVWSVPSKGLTSYELKVKAYDASGNTAENRVVVYGR
jgi:hypothetical protein